MFGKSALPEIPSLRDNDNAEKRRPGAISYFSRWKQSRQPVYRLAVPNSLRLSQQVRPRVLWLAFIVLIHRFIELHLNYVLYLRVNKRMQRLQCIPKSGPAAIPPASTLLPTVPPNPLCASHIEHAYA
jgi:hypothetical protein